MLSVNTKWVTSAACLGGMGWANTWTVISLSLAVLLHGCFQPAASKWRFLPFNIQPFSLLLFFFQWKPKLKTYTVHIIRRLSWLSLAEKCLFTKLKVNKVYWQIISKLELYVRNVLMRYASVNIFIFTITVFLDFHSSTLKEEWVICCKFYLSLL